MMRSLIVAAGLVIVSLAASEAGAQGARPGKVLFDRWCSGCHAPAEPNKIGRLGPSVPAGTQILGDRYGKDIPAALEQRTDLTPELIKTVVRSGVGFMPFFRKTELSDAQVNQLADYLSKNKAASLKASKARGKGR